MFKILSISIDFGTVEKTFEMQKCIVTAFKKMVLDNLSTF